MMWNHTKPETLPPIIRRVRCLCENIILYKYQVTLIIFYSFLFSSKILQDTKNSGISSAPFNKLNRSFFGCAQ